jgi:hypothetical protein
MIILIAAEDDPDHHEGAKALRDQEMAWYPGA